MVTLATVASLVALPLNVSENLINRVNLAANLAVNQLNAKKKPLNLVIFAVSLANLVNVLLAVRFQVLPSIALT